MEFLASTQNLCKTCDEPIFLFGGFWRHRKTISSRCPEPHLTTAEPKFVQGSPEHLQAINL